jgi:hypothetical protein
MSDELKQRAEAYLALAEKATQGKWYEHGDTVWAPPDSDDEGSTCVAQECTNEDAEFIAAGHEAAAIIREQQAEIERLRAAESWTRAQTAKYPTKPSAGSTYSAGFDVGYALAMEQAARAFDAVPNDSFRATSAEGAKVAPGSASCAGDEK